MTRSHAGPHARVRAAAAIAIGLAIGLSTALDARQAKPLLCATLLTDAELLKATGDKFALADSLSRDSGTSECTWIARTPAGAKSVVLQFFEPSHIEKTTAKTIPAFFKMMAAPAADQKSEPLAGVGLNAALITADPQRAGVVQLANGVAYIVANNLTQPQVAAVARATATP